MSKTELEEKLENIIDEHATTYINATKDYLIDNISEDTRDELWKEQDQKTKAQILALLSTSQREAEVSLLNELTDSQIDSQDLERSTPGFSHEVIPASVIYDKLKQSTDTKEVKGE